MRWAGITRRVFLLAYFIGAILSASASGQEPDRGPEGGEQEHLVKAVLAGHEFGPEALQMARRHMRSHLVRPELDIGQKAHYSIAEIYLKREEPEKAVAKLRELLARIREPDEAAWVTLFNIAQILRYRIKDTAGAVEAYGNVRGVLQPMAQAELIEALLSENRADKAALLLEKRLEETQELGEKLMLLDRLGGLYRKVGMEEEALKTFEEIARTATPERLSALRREAAAEVQAAFREIRRFQVEERWEEAERAHRDLRRRLGRLVLQGRSEEAGAMRREIHRQEREMRQFHEEREARERQRHREAERRERQAE